MASAGIGAVRLVDKSGDALDDDSGKLNVNATLVAGATIDIGDVDIFLDGGTAILGGAGAVAAGVLRVTLASDDPAVVDLAAMEVLLGTISTNVGGSATTLATWQPAIGFYTSAINDNTSGLSGCIETFGTAHDTSSRYCCICY